MPTKRKSLDMRTSIVLGLGLVVIGAILLLATMQIGLGGSTAHQRTFADIVRKDGPKTNNKAVDAPSALSGVPVQIDIPDVSISLKVVPGYYYPKTQSWTLSLNDAQYGAMTAPANNEGGMTFIYAHNRKGVFNNLPKILPGTLASVSTDNKHVFTYSFRTSVITSPSDTSLFSYTGPPIMVAQTCTGSWYQDRQLFIFDLVGAK